MQGIVRGRTRVGTVYAALIAACRRGASGSSAAPSGSTDAVSSPIVNSSADS